VIEILTQALGVHFYHVDQVRGALVSALPFDPRQPLLIQVYAVGALLPQKFRVGATGEVNFCDGLFEFARYRLVQIGLSGRAPRDQVAVRPL